MSGERQLPLLNELLRHLAQAFGTAALYAPDHPRVLNSLPAILDPLKQLLAATPELTLVVVNDDLLFLGRPLAQTPHTARVARPLGALGIGHIKFFPGIDIPEVRNRKVWLATTYSSRNLTSESLRSVRQTRSHSLREIPA